MKKKIIHPYYQLHINFNFTDFYIGNEYQKYSISRKFSQKVLGHFQFQNPNQCLVSHCRGKLNWFERFCKFLFEIFSEQSKDMCWVCFRQKNNFLLWWSLQKKKRKKKCRDFFVVHYNDLVNWHYHSVLFIQ